MVSRRPLTDSLTCWTEKNWPDGRMGMGVVGRGGGGYVSLRNDS